MSRPRALILAPPLPGIAGGIRDAFTALGWEAELVQYQAVVRQRGWRRLVGVDYEKQRAEFFNLTLREEVLPRLKSPTAPQFFLILKGAALESDNREALRTSGVKSALWTYDSLYRLPRQDDLRELVDRVFYMDGDDARDEKSLWLPLGFDPSLYQSATGQPGYDVLFVGRMGRGYEGRKRYLARLAKSGVVRRHAVAVIGSTGSRWGDWRLGLGKHIRRIAGHLPPAEYAREIARAKVCINIHQDDGGRPVNPTFFAVPGAGVCQVTDNRDYLSRWLTPNYDYVPAREAQLEETIENLLRDETLRSCIARQGYQSAIANHTFRARLGTILKEAGFDKSATV